MGDYLHEVTFQFLHPGTYAVAGCAKYSFQVYSTSETRAIVGATTQLLKTYPDLDIEKATDINVEVFK